eukprot:scaffold23770_cov43-Attheya_sp.AAC.4
MENLPLVDLVALQILPIPRMFSVFIPTLRTILDPSINSFILRVTTVTFEDLDGRPLLFPSENRPWRRILGTHSILAHRKARNNGYLIGDQLTEAESSAQESIDFSLDGEAQARIRMVFSNP